MRHRTALLIPRALVLLLGVTAAAQVPSWSPEWATAGLGGTVFALDTYNNEVHAGGVWFAAKGGVIRGLAKFDGADWRPVGGGLDLVNYSFPPRDTRVAAMTLFQGELVFAGTFDRVGSQPIESIARFDGTTVRPLGTGLRLSFDEADVRGLAVFQNELFAVGQFDTAGGVPVAGIARWNGTSWSAVGTGLRDSISGTIGYPRCVHVHGASLVVGGQFDRAGGVVARNIARWSGTAWSAFGTGSLAPVYALESYGTQLVAAGQFQLAGGNVAMPGTWNGTSWTAMGANAPTVPSTTLRAFGTKLYADTGTVLSQFDGATWSMAGLVNGIFSGFEGTSIRALHGHNGELFLGGEFTRAGSIPNQPAVASSNVCAFDGGSGWRSLGGGLGVSGRVDRLVPWRGGWVAAGVGDAGAAPTSGLAFYDGDRWNVLGSFTGGNGGVYDCAVFGGDLIVTGSFTHIDGQPFSGIARFDGTQWHPFGTLAVYALHVHGNELFAYGATALQRWNGSAFVIAATPPTGGIDRLWSHSDGLLYIANNDAFTHRVLVWNGTSLQQIGTANDFIQSVSGFGTEVVIGGRFTAVSGTAANLMARWNGTAWRAMPAPVSGYSTYAFAELDGDLYAGISGDPRGDCLRLHNGTWQPLGNGTIGMPTMLFVDRATASVYLSAGDLLTAGGLPCRNFAEWRTQPDWRNRLHGTAGSSGVPLLAGRGTAQIGTSLQWTVEAPANAAVLFAAGTARIDLPLLGALLVPLPEVVLFSACDAAGIANIALQLPPTMPIGASVWSQTWVIDPSGPQGFSATNALECTTRL
ncbi:MAG: hypothetical protein ABL997_04840 [Planctomycetota bacterium]